ncbi:MAG: cysteine desulfurase family protein [Bacteroidota bacterium]
MKNLYFDNAATTRIDERVLETMLPYLKESYGNPSSAHGMGRTGRLAVETSRRKIASILNCHPNSIVFTSCGTESANMALRCAVTGVRLSHVVTSRTEHACVLQTARNLHFSGKASLSYVAINDQGTAQLTDLNELLEKSHGRSMVALMHANNETGTPLNMALAGEICRRHKAIFFSDCVQTVGHYPIDLSQMPVDMISASAHKFHGPKGIGFLYIREGLPLQALLTGGSHERNMRAGTENVASIVGMAIALEIAARNYAEDSKHTRQLKLALKEKLIEAGAVVNGVDNDSALYTVLNVRFPKTQATENLLLELDMAGVAVSGGSACSAGKGGSHVMEAIGASDAINIRFSFSKYNTMEEVNRLGVLLEELLTLQI